MARETLDRKIKHLLVEFLILDSMIKYAIQGSINALKKQDLEMAQQLYANDKVTNTKRIKLGNECITTRSL